MNHVNDPRNSVPVSSSTHRKLRHRRPGKWCSSGSKEGRKRGRTSASRWTPIHLAARRPHPGFTLELSRFCRGGSDGQPRGASASVRSRRAAGHRRRTRITNGSRTSERRNRAARPLEFFPDEFSRCRCLTGSRYLSTALVITRRWHSGQSSARAFR